MRALEREMEEYAEDLAAVDGNFFRKNQFS